MPKTDILIAPASPDIAATLADICRRTFYLGCPESTTQGDIDAFLEARCTPAHFAQYLADPARMILLARHGTDVVGYAMVALPPANARASNPSAMAELRHLYVLADHHQTGIGSRLLQAVLTSAEAAAGLKLSVSSANQSAIAFYERHGFRITGEHVFRVGTDAQRDFEMQSPAP